MRSFAWVFLAALTACGGKVVVDGIDDGTGGGGGSGGASSSASSSSASSSSASSSSASSSSSSASSSSSSASSSSSGTGVSCPEPFPGIFAPCDVEGQVCQVPLACCSGSAVCKGGYWIYTGAICNDCTPQCGPDNFACEPDAVCVTYIGPVTSYQCRPNPCGGGLACGCAEMLCAEQGMSCNNIQGGYKVLCD